MKNKNNSSNTTHNIPDVDIIDLDLMDLAPGSDADQTQSPDETPFDDLLKDR